MGDVGQALLSKGNSSGKTYHCRTPPGTVNAIAGTLRSEPYLAAACLTWGELKRFRTSFRSAPWNRRGRIAKMVAFHLPCPHRVVT